MSANPSYRPSERRVPCGTAIVMLRDVDDRPEILLLHRTGSHASGTWSVPGGWLEPREQPEEGVCREAWEEVGVTIEPAEAAFKGYTVDSYDGDSVHDICLWFETRTWSGTPHNTNPDRIDAVQWLPLEELRGHFGPLFPAMLNALRKGIL